MNSAFRLALIAGCCFVAGCGKSAADRVYDHCMAEVNKAFAQADSSPNNASPSAFADMASKMGHEVCEKAREACKQDPKSQACEVGN